MPLLIVDGGWSEWMEFQPCTATKCGNGTKMLKRFCSNPEPENGGQFCTGRNVRIEQCQDVCPGNIQYATASWDLIINSFACQFATTSCFWLLISFVLCSGQNRAQQLYNGDLPWHFAYVSCSGQNGAQQLYWSKFQVLQTLQPLYQW